MSSLWTPGGEHPVERDEPQPEPAGGTPPPTGDEPLTDEQVQEMLENMSPEERAQAEEMARQMAEARQRLVEAPPEAVVANHAMGLYELAALHLSQPSPDLEAAQLAVDALAALVENLSGRLGEAETTLNDALTQIRLAYVQVKDHVEGGGTD